MKNLPALKAVLLMAAGILCGRFFTVPAAYLLAVCCLTVVTGVLFLFSRVCGRAQTLVLCAALISFGALSYSMSRLASPKDLHRFHGSSAFLTCRLIEPVTPKNNSFRLLAAADSLQVSGGALQQTDGRLIIYTRDPQAAHLRYGDIFTVSGTLSAPAGRRNPGAFDYRAYLACRGIRTLMYADRRTPLIRTGKNRGSVIFRRLILPAKKSMQRAFLVCSGSGAMHFLSALVLGDRSRIDPQLREDFARAGVVHVLAVSGLHVGFVLLIFSSIGSILRLGRFGSTFFVLTGLAFYVMLTGQGAPVVRAALMGGFYLLGKLVERKSGPFNLIGAAALILLVINPARLFDTGFQLSFAAVFSILYIYPKLAELPAIRPLLRRKKPFFLSPLITALLVSFSAQAGTLPFTACYFQRLPLLAVLINLPAVPLAGIITALGFTTWIAWLINPWAGAVYGALNRELIELLTGAVSYTGSLPFAYINVPAPPLLLSLVFFGFLAILLNLRNIRAVKPVLFFCLILLNLYIWPRAAAARGRLLRWIQFDVGQGDAALLRLPRGRTILIDGGDRTPAFDNGARVIAPYLHQQGIRRLDLVVATHPHNDHIGGLIEIAEQFSIGKIAVSKDAAPAGLYTRFLETAHKRGIPLLEVSGSDTLIFPGVTAVLTRQFTEVTGNGGNPDRNNMSIVTRIRYGKTNIMFMGDAEKEAEAALLRSGFPVGCDAVKAGHHGSRTSSSLPFLLSARPRIAVISVGDPNRYRHPSGSIIDRYRQLETDILRTDRQGAVILTSDGRKLKIVPWNRPE